MTGFQVYGWVVLGILASIFWPWANAYLKAVRRRKTSALPESIWNHGAKGLFWTVVASSVIAGIAIALAPAELVTKAPAWGAFLLGLGWDSLLAKGVKTGTLALNDK